MPETSKQFEPSHEYLQCESDPRKEADFSKLMQILIHEQYEHFRTYGRAQHSFLASEQEKMKLIEANRLVIDGSALYLPKPEATKKIPEEPVKESMYEELLRESVQRLDTYARIADKIARTYNQSAGNPVLPVCAFQADTKYDFAKPELLKEYSNRTHYLLEFLHAAEKIIPLVLKEKRILDTLRKQAIAQKVLAEYLIQRNYQEIEAKIEETMNQYFEEKYMTIDTKALRRVSGLISDSTARLYNAQQCIDTDDPRFLSTPTRSPLYLSAHLESLKEIFESYALDDWNFLETHLAGVEAILTAQSQEEDERKSVIVDIVKTFAAEREEEETRSPLASPPSQKPSEEKEAAPVRAEGELVQALKEALGKEPVRPTLALTERFPSSLDFREVDRETLFDVIDSGAKTHERELLLDGAFYHERRVTLAENGYKDMPTLWQEDAAVRTIAHNEALQPGTGIFYARCREGKYIPIPAKNGFQLTAIGWSKLRTPEKQEDIEAVPVYRNIGDGTCSFTSPKEGYVHYVLAKEETLKDAPKQEERDEPETYLETFVVPEFMDQSIQEIVARAQTQKTAEHQVRAIKRGLRGLGRFVYEYGSSLLDTLYTHPEQKRLHPLMEKIGIGDCALYTVLLAHILRRASIPARIALGRTIHNDSFRSYGHAIVEYWNSEKTQWEECEATDIALSTKQLHKRHEMSQHVLERFYEQARIAATHTDPFLVDFACRSIRDLLLRNLTELEHNAKKLEAFQERYKRQCQEIEKRKLETEQDIETVKESVKLLFELGLDYSRFHISEYSAQQIEDPHERRFYEKYTHVDTRALCSSYINTFLNKKLIEAKGILLPKHVIEYTEALINQDREDRWRKSPPVREHMIFRDAGGHAFVMEKLPPPPPELQPLLISLQNRIGGYEAGKAIAASSRILEAAKLADDTALVTTETIRGFLDYAHEHKENQDKIMELVLLFISRAYPREEGALFQNPREKERAQEVEQFAGEYHERIKELLFDRKALPKIFSAKTGEIEGGFVKLITVLDNHVYLTNEEKERLVYEYIEGRQAIALSENISKNLHDLVSALSLSLKPDTTLHKERQAVVDLLQRACNHRIGHLINFYRITAPFISDGDGARVSLSAETANAFLMYNSSEARGFNTFFLDVKKYFPELAVPKEYIDRWNQKAREYQETHTMETLAIGLTRRGIDTGGLALEFTQSGVASPLRAGNIIDISRSLSPVLKAKIFGEQEVNLLETLQRICPYTQEIPLVNRCILQCLSSIDAVQNALQKEFNTHKEQFPRIALEYFLAHAPAARLHEFWLLFSAGKHALQIPQEIKDEIIALYEQVPQRDREEVLALHREHISSGGAEPALQQKIQEVFTVHQTRSIWDALVAEKYRFSHPFGSLYDVSNELFARLKKTAESAVGFTEQVEKIMRKGKRETMGVGGDIPGTKKAPGSIEPVDRRPYSQGDPFHAIDWKTYAKTERYYTKLVLPEQEARVSSHRIDIDRLVKEHGDHQFIPYDRWGEVFNQEYDALLAAMINATQNNRPLKIEVYFHNAPVLANLDIPAGAKSARLEILRNRLLVIFAELNKLVPLLKEECRRAHDETTHLKHSSTAA